MSSQIQHNAIITAVDKGKVTVSIDDSGASCDGCKVAAICGTPAGKVSHSIAVDDADAYSVGQRVTIAVNDTSTWRAIIIGLAVPCAILLLGVLVSLALGLNQTLSVGITLLVVALYYIVLAFNRRAIESRIVWRILPPPHKPINP